MTTATMTAPATPKTAVRKERFCDIVHEDGLRFLKIRQVRHLKTKSNETTTYYRLTEFQPDWGRAFRLAKVGGDRAVYEVNLGDADNAPTCGLYRPPEDGQAL